MHKSTCVKKACVRLFNDALGLLTIRRRGKQIVSFYKWPKVQDTEAPTTHDKRGSLKELEHRQIGWKVLILKYDLVKSLSKEICCKMAGTKNLDYIF